MADEIVGTAFVRIKALTKGLGKDIQKSVEKGMKDAKLDKVGEDGGKQLGTSMGDATVDSASERIKSRSDEFIPDSLVDDMKKKVQSGFGDFDFFPPDAEENLRQTMDRQVETINESVDKVNKKVDGFGGQSRKTKRDSDNLNGSLDKLANTMRGFGSGSGMPSFGGIFTKAIGGIAGLAVAALPYIQDLGSGILAYGTGIVAQLGFMTTAAVGLAAAAGAAIGSALLPILPIMLAFKAESDALTEFKDSMAAAVTEFQSIGLVTQSTLLPALDRAVFQLGELIPMFSEFGLFAGLAVGQFAELAAATLTSEKAQGRFGEILRSSLRILDMILPTVLNLGDIFSGLWVAAIPASERFVAALANMVQHWADIVNYGLNSGGLTETLNTWYDRAELLGSALGNVIGALFDILSVGADSADNVFVRFDEWAERFRDWTESEVGQNKLKLIFDNALVVMREVNGIASELIDDIFGRLDDVGGVDSMVESLQRFKEILPGIKEGVQDFIDQVRDINSEVLPIIETKLRQAFEELREPIGRLVYAIVDVMQAMEESGAFETFLTLLSTLADVLSAVLNIPGFGTFIGYMIAFGGAAKVASFALGPLLTVLSPFVGVLQGIIAARAGQALAQTADGIVRVASAAKASGSISTASLALSNMATATKGGAGGGLVGTFARLAPALAGMGPAGLLAVGGIGLLGGAIFQGIKRSNEFKQEVRQITDELGLLNDGLNVTATGISNYLTEESRFLSRNQDDDLKDMGLSFAELSEQIANGTASFVDFADQAIAAGQLKTEISFIEESGVEQIREVSTSLGGLRNQFKLTSDDMTELAKGNPVMNGDGYELALTGNLDLIDSFIVTTDAIGTAVKENIDDFSKNAQVVRLIGRDALNEITSDIKESENIDAGFKMAEAMDRVGAAARRDTKEVTELTSAIEEQIKSQTAHLTGNERALKINELMRSEQTKLFNQIRDDYDLFNSLDFSLNFGDARREIFEFTGVLNQFSLNTKAGFEGFQLTAAFEDLKVLGERFPGVGDAAKEMFATLRGLPQAEFNAAARAMNVDADSLKTAMSGAQEAIANLQTAALEKLPSIQEALDANLKTTEDGGQYFDTAGFTAAATDRVNQTTTFAEDIKHIHEKQGSEAARLALQQGPASARALSEALATDPKGVEFQLARMRYAEGALAGTVEDLFGGEVAAEYFAKVKPVGDAMGVGVTAGLNSPATMNALGRGGANLLNSLVAGFQGRFEWSGDGVRFIRTGVFRSANTQLKRINFGMGMEGFSQGGFVGAAGAAFGSGPKGTDTVPAWLTPGEFVLRRAVAQAIPSRTLIALNEGNPQLISMLKSIDRSRPGVPGATLSDITATVASPRGGTGAGTFGPNSVVIYAQGTSAREVYNEFDHRVNWKLTSRGDR